MSETGAKKAARAARVVYRQAYSIDPQESLIVMLFDSPEQYEELRAHLNGDVAP